MTHRPPKNSLSVRWVLAFLPALLLTFPLAAQTTTARLQGTVRDTSGAPIAGIAVLAIHIENGFNRAAVTSKDGAYNLVLPPGPYEVSAGSAAHQEKRTTLRLQVGATVEHNFTLSPGKMVAQTVSVTASAADATPQADIRSPEIATNVTEMQVKSLPQSSRNFLNFAALAPGVRLSRDEQNQSISYGAQGALNTNVFIDGSSYKNDVLQGGVVGQDSSRGNPFPQNAVQEFRVITQNYKAEYQKASSAIISAVTKSGGNEFHGDVFTYYQNKNLVAQDELSKQRGEQKPEYTRWQPGVSLGGPIAKDKFHFFVSYEGNYQNRESSVFLGSSTGWTPDFRSQFNKYTGIFPSDFRASLFFGKLTANLAEGSTLDISSDVRTESDVRDFGGQSSYEQARDLKIDTTTVRAKHTILFGNFLNEASLSYQKFSWNQAAISEGAVGKEYQGLMTIGGTPTTQDIYQERFAVRDDLTLLTLQGAGEHVIKGGFTLDFLDYHVIKYQDANPMYHFRPDAYATVPGDMPFRAEYSIGNPDLSTNNTQFGIYLQDDWRINARLTANIGLRWDFETDELNNDYVTPQNIVQGLKSVYPSSYFTDGSQRPVFYGAIQPRIGLSYDISGEGKTVAHGGYGKYYDRTLYNDILDEKFRQQWTKRIFYFSKDGSPVDGNPAIKWDPSYLTKAGLDKLISSGQAPAPEIFLLDNDTEPPSSDQWSLGIRHNFGPFNVGLDYTGVYSKNQLTWTCGIKAKNGSCDWGARPDPTLGFSMISRGKETWFNSFQVSIDKPFTASSKWGGSLSYVYGDAEQTGNDLFSWGTFDPVNGVKQRSNIAQKHQITMSAIYLLPAGFKVSTLVTTGSGYPFYVTDCSLGWDKCVEMIGGGDPPKWTQSIDFRADKQFSLGGSYNLGISVELINAFNYTNEKDYDGWKPALPEVNTHFGRPWNTYNPRRVQVGFNFGF